MTNKNSEICHNIYVMLDRVKIAGHEERKVMNQATDFLAALKKMYLAEEAKPPEGDNLTE